MTPAAANPVATSASEGPAARGNRLRILAAAILAVSVASLLLFSGCSRGEGASNASARPTVLRIAMTVSEETVEERVTAYAALAKHLSDRLKLRVEIVETNGYAPAIEALRSGKLDVCTSSPMPYLVAQSKVGVVPLVVPAMPDGAPSSYHSMFITYAETGLRTLDDVKARASSLIVAFADPASTSGHLIPRAQLESMGINAEKAFKQVIFAANHTASVMTVKSHKVHIAAITKTLFDRMVADGRIAAKDFVILWVSPPLQQSVVYTRATLPAGLRDELQAAYLDLAKDRPDIWKGLRTRSTSGAIGYAPANDAMFDEFRRIARNLEHMKLLD